MEVAEGQELEVLPKNEEEEKELYVIIESLKRASLDDVYSRDRLIATTFTPFLAIVVAYQLSVY